ncbi:MAG: hypothetical protein HKN24_12910 [Acidimicrobiales bacterium]|nr:hypothetical protein [Acidimicrobiales bacterium]
MAATEPQETRSPRWTSSSRRPASKVKIWRSSITPGAIRGGGAGALWAILSFPLFVALNAIYDIDLGFDPDPYNSVLQFLGVWAVWSLAGLLVGPILGALCGAVIGLIVGASYDKWDRRGAWAAGVGSATALTALGFVLSEPIFVIAGIGALIVGYPFLRSHINAIESLALRFLRGK